MVAKPEKDVNLGGVFCRQASLRWGSQEEGGPTVGMGKPPAPSSLGGDTRLKNGGTVPKILGKIQKGGNRTILREFPMLFTQKKGKKKRGLTCSSCYPSAHMISGLFDAIANLRHKPGGFPLRKVQRAETVIQPQWEESKQCRDSLLGSPHFGRR